MRRGCEITSQRLTEEEIADFRKNYDYYQDVAAKKGDGDLFDRGICEAIYLLDKETNTVAEFTLIPKESRKYTEEYKNKGIKALNAKYQTSLELSGKLYILTDKNQLKKWKDIPHTDFTRPQLEKTLPGVVKTTYVRICQRIKEAKIIDREISCSFDGDIKKPQIT